MEFKIDEGSAQYRFLFSQAKFPCFIGGIGCGKSAALLLKIITFLEKNPGTTGLIVRREYSDLASSTLVDLERYFRIKVDQNKNYKFPNGSTLMLRHGDELNVLRGLNLSIIGLEEAHEWPNDEQFQFLRDRLRQDSDAKVLPLCIACNARGRNWIYEKFILGSQATTIRQETGEFEYLNGEYHCVTATTFANPHLRPDFIADIKRRELEAPGHHRQFVLNDFSEEGGDDQVFDFKELRGSQEKQFAMRAGFGLRVLGFDVARMGNDLCAVVGIVQLSSLVWEVFIVDKWGKTDLDTTTGKISWFHNNKNADRSIIDIDGGYGSGPYDTLSKKDKTFESWNNTTFGRDTDSEFGNRRSKEAFALRDMVNRGHIIIKDEELIQQLLTLRFTFTNDGRRILVSKEEMRRKGVRSPDIADACIMAISLIPDVQRTQETQYVKKHSQQQNWNPFRDEGDNLFGIAGVR